MANQFMLRFFNSKEATQSDKEKLLRAALTLWPLSYRQMETILDTVKNYPGDWVDLFYRPGRDVAMIYVYEGSNTTKSAFNAKIEKDGAYA